MKEIILSKGGVAIVDDDDYEKLCEFNWYIVESRTPGRVYACRKVNGKKLYMHKSLLECSDLDIDHINGNALDNRKSNLRTVTRSQNNYNSSTRKGCSSKYKGVSISSSNSKFRAIAKIDGKNKHLGYFANELEAASAYDSAAVKHFGEYARFNFPVSLLAVALQEKSVP